MKYPIGIQNFEKIRLGDYIYIDKTDMVYKLVNEGSYYFLSRPRRFGKSLLISTIEAYLSGKRELFQGLAIEQLEKEWTVHPILHLDLNTDKYDSEGVLESRLNLFLANIEDVYGRNPHEKTISQRFEGVIKRVYEKEGRKVVILVDEYDKPMLQAIGNDQLQQAYRNMLKSFYGALKSCDQYIKLAFLTGVTKFGQVSVFSDLNNLTDLSMDERYQTICGITKEEIQHYFKEPVQQLAERYHISMEETFERLRKNYDGYHFVEFGEGIYNPFSLLNVFSKTKFSNYWFATGTPTFLVQLLQQTRYPLADMTEEQVSADFLNSIDSMSVNPIPVIYQSGYLTIKDYDEEFRIYRLGFPNMEVEDGFINYLLPFYTHSGEAETNFSITHFVQDIRKGNPEGFMQRMAALLSDTDYRIVGDAELYFQNAFYLIAKMLGFYTEVERATSNGRMDMVIQTKDFVYIIEFKYDSTPETALQQIKDMGYDKPFATDNRKLFRIGVNFSKTKRCVDGWIVDTK